MPELVEVERYRQLAETLVGFRIGGVDIVDPLAVRGHGEGTDLRTTLVGRTLTAARRRGKLLLLDTGAAAGPADSGPTLGMRFGMSGTLVVDGRPGVDRLVYSPASLHERWTRFRLVLRASGSRSDDVRELVLHDPRRLGKVELDPCEDSLGPDAAGVSAEELRLALTARSRAVGPSPVPLKARLMDQGRLAGVGNLIADEVLWRAGLAPERPADTLSDAELRRLHGQLCSTLADLAARGGSHTGDLMAERHTGGRCPNDGCELLRTRVGGRTTWWCPRHQR